MTLKDFFYNTINDTQEFGQLVSRAGSEKLTKISGTFGSYVTMMAAALFKNTDRSVVFLCKSDSEAESFAGDFSAYGIERTYIFPSDGTTPYHDVPVNTDISSQRLEVIKHLLRDEHCVVVTSVRALFDAVVPKECFDSCILTFRTGDDWNLNDLTKRLAESGYVRVEKVSLAGEFAVRGNIIDIYYSTFKSPVRLDFFDTEIESIKAFNPYTQKSEETLDEVTIPPHKEFIFGENEIADALERVSSMAGDEESKQTLTDNIKSRLIFDGIQNYIPLFYRKSSLADYFDNAILLVNDYASISNAVDNLYDEYRDNYGITAFNIKPKIAPEERLFTIEEIYAKFNNIIEANNLNDASHPFDVKFGGNGLPVYLGNLDNFRADIRSHLDKGYRVIIFAVNEIQCERLLEIFKSFEPVDDRFEFRQSGVSIVPLSMNFGFCLDSQKLLCINDYEIFGKKTKISKHFYKKRTEMIDTFLDLVPGDYVVEVHHGVGQFLGVERVKSMGAERDYIAIQYADDERIFIPVEQLNFVQKYVSAGIGKPKLDKVGGKGWNKTKEKVRESVEKLARELVQLYSERQKIKGYQFAPDLPWQKEFEAKFPYDETEDQLLTIEEVKRDMESDKIMDRLICGDVGFGKTEVAIRAAFKAVMSGKQVAILVPTTILAEQHYTTFRDRMKDYPIKIDMLCRFRTAAEQEATIRALKAGDVDIIVGTHRLLSSDVKYRNLGLIIIDEEHRFGVKHKETLKKARLTVDSISMTATPIPRTLHMSLANIRDMSVINTPPRQRIPVETYVMEFNEEVLINAVNKELDRGGQIFFVYNRVTTILEMKKYLNRICPRARVVISHAQMPEEHLENIIHDFINYEYDILLTTTIVESGIDIPRANTIIIDRADRFGLAQLYQLRGRVGRADIQAYAYMFYNADGTVTEDAMKRLKVISQYTDLGSGFKVAMKDLEIRGAGNIFGAEQSGNILAVGFHLYCKLLNDAIAELSRDPNFKEEIVPVEKEVSVNLAYKGYIPNSYITDARQKIECYKRIAGIVYPEEIDEIRQTMTDRFGPIPSQVEELLYIADVRLVCKKHNITEITEKTDYIQIIFDTFDNVDINRLMNVIAKSSGRVYINNAKANSVFIKQYVFDEWTLKQKWDYAKELIEKIVVKRK
ncbi:MAG: transcription-repair coupling factor [Spirochaetales bacterium]|nr:transcription-repair coupling factor [Spirochaetales bacterium]